MAVLVERTMEKKKERNPSKGTHRGVEAVLLLVQAEGHGVLSSSVLTKRAGTSKVELLLVRTEKEPVGKKKKNRRES